MSYNRINSNYSSCSYDEKDISSQSSDNQEINKSRTSINIKKESALFDILLNTKKYSFLIIKAIFSCLFDKFDKETKIKFIKNEIEDFGGFKDFFGKYDKYKKKLFNQFLLLIEYINEEKVLYQSLELIFKFLVNAILGYVNDANNKITKTLFLRLFGDKLIFKDFFLYSINNDIISNEELKNSIINFINYINKVVLLYHPKPFIFSFIKDLIQSEREETIFILNNILNSFNENINSDIFRLNNIFVQNFLKFISTLVNALYMNQIYMFIILHFQKLKKKKIKLNRLSNHQNQNY